MRLLQFVKKSISGLAQPQRWFKESVGIEETDSGIDLSPEGALAVSAVTACVRLLSESVASLPLFVYRRTATSKEKTPEHELYFLLHDSPNSYQTSYVWRQQMMSHVLMHGNSYNFIERNEAGKIVALWPLVPENVTVIAKDGVIRFDYFQNAQRKTYSFDEVLHVKGPSLNGITGLSIVSLARQGIGLARAQDQHGARMFKNHARPGMAISVPNRLNEVQRQSIRENFAKYEGALNSGKTVILEEGWTLSSVGFSNEDAQFLQSRQFSVQEIARWFRVSPTMIGDLSRSTYSNSEQEQLAFLQHSLRPWLVNIESELNGKLFPARTQFFSEFDMAGIARGDQASRYEAYSKGLAAGFLTVADVRRWENLPEILGTDQLLRPANMLPAGETNAQ